MSDTILKGFAKQSDGLEDFFSKHLGIQAIKKGNDLILPDKSVAAAIASSKIVTLHHQITLSEGREVENAQQMYQQIPEDLKKYQLPQPDKIVAPSDNYGLLSEIYIVNSLLAVESEQKVAELMSQRVIPHMRSNFGARHVTGVSVDANYQQAWMSIVKIALLVERYGPIEAARLVKENDAFAGALPSPVDVLSFLESLTRFSPYAFTLPLRRMGCAWHFQGEAMWDFHSTIANGQTQEFMLAISPMSEESHVLGLAGLRNMSEKNIWRYLRFVVGGFNRLFRYLNDPRNFRNQDGSTNFLQMVQAYSAIHFLFADLAAMNFSTVAHNRTSYAMSTIDKLSNLRVQIGGITATEEEAFVAFASRNQLEELIRVYVRVFGDMGYEELGDSFASVARHNYHELHEGLKKQGSEETNSEIASLERIRYHRNMRHGAFLHRNQFEKLFLESSGHIPAAFSTLPFLLVLGLLCDPERFLRFSPAASN